MTTRQAARRIFLEYAASGGNEAESLRMHAEAVARWRAGVERAVRESVGGAGAGERDDPGADLDTEASASASGVVPPLER